ncbi:MAG: leucine-rich repeat protein [Prevotella sp.]|nr:leucine-rich repeat protein [Prevotella sp.]
MKYKAGGPVSTYWYRTAYDDVDNTFTTDNGPISSDDNPCGWEGNYYSYPSGDYAETYLYTYFTGEAGKTYYLEISVDDVADIYFNGNAVQQDGETGYYPLENAIGGENTIAVRYDNSGGGSGYFDYAIYLHVPDTWWRNDGSWPMKSMLTDPQTDANGKKWFETGYDDSLWDEVLAPLDRNHFNEGGKCYLRGYANINLSTLPLIVEMYMVADDQATIYLNGNRIGEAGIYGNSLTIPRWLFVDGENLLAIYWDDPTGGDAYLRDLSFYESSQGQIDFEYQGLSYHGDRNVNGDFDLSVTGYDDSSPTVVIPDDVYGIPVIAISDDAFSGTGVTSISIPASVTSIGENVFDGCQLNTISVDANNAYYESVDSDKGLMEKANPNTLLYAATGLTLPSTITDIAPNAFASTTEVTINHTTPPTWNYDTDYGCNLSRLTIYVPAANYYDYVDAWPWAFGSLMVIGATQDVTVTVSAKQIRSDLHDQIGEDNLQFVTSLKVIGTINSYDIMIMRHKMVRLQHIDLSEATIVYNPYEYYTGYCSEDNLLTTNAFCELDRLQTIKLPRTITGIEADAFANTPNLREVVMYEGLQFIEGAFGGTSIEEITIPYSVTEVRDNAFANTTVQKVIFAPKPDGVDAKTEVTTIGTSAFEGCGSLAEVTLSEGINIIGSRAFSCCDALEEIAIPYSVTEVGREAFSNHNDWGREAFNGLANLHKVTFAAQPEGIAAKTVETTIGAGAFAGCRSLSEVTLNEGVTIIEDRAFSECDALEEITIPHSVHTINQAFSKMVWGSWVGLQNLKKVTFAGKLEGENPKAEQTSIAANIFHNSPSLEQVTFNGDNYAIGESAFMDCGTLANVTLNEGLARIESSTFQNCYSLQSIEIPYSVTDIDGNAFNGSGLQTVRLSAKEDDQEAKELSKLKKIGPSAFANCALVEIMLPDKLRVIEEGAFQGNGDLVEVHLPSSIKTIGENAFADCGNIKRYYVKRFIPQQVEMHTFSNYQTSTLYVPEKPMFTQRMYYWDTEWSKFLRLDTYNANYSGSDGQIGDDDQGSGTDFKLEDGDRILGTGNMYVYSYGGIIIEGSDVQPFGDFHLMGDGTDGASLIDQGNITVENLFFDINIDPERWYFLTFPFNVNFRDITAPGRHVFRYYDGNERASNGSGGWKNVPADAEYLEAGKGYIFNCESIDEGEEDEWGNIIGKLTGKVENPVFNGQQKDLSLKTYISDSNQDASWNLLGNPYPCYYDINAMGYESPITIWNGDGYDSYRPGDDAYILHPFEAFFVQKPENVANVQFPLDGRLTYLQTQANQSPAPKRKVDTAVTRLFINLTLTDGEHSDRTRVVFNEKKTIAYDLGDDAAKFMANAIPQLYTLDELGNRFSINERPAGSVMLGVKVPQQGTYTISAKKMDCPVLLLDKETGLYIDLTVEDYQFECHAGTLEDRFVLVYDTHADGIAQLYGATGVSVMPTEGGIGIQGAGLATVEIYNAGGALVGTSAGDGLTPLAKGVYVVKVNNHSAKVVVK